MHLYQFSRRLNTRTSENPLVEIIVDEAVQRIPNLLLSRPCHALEVFMPGRIWKVFMPGRIWNSVLFPPDHDITDSSIYLFVAVLFYVDQTFEGWGASRLERAERCMGR